MSQKIKIIIVFQASFLFAGHRRAKNRERDAFQVLFLQLTFFFLQFRPIDLISETRNAHSRVFELAQMANEIEKDLFREF